MKIENFLKPTILTRPAGEPEATHEGISPVPPGLSSGTEILYFASPGPETSGAKNGSSDLSQGEVNRKPRPKGRRISRFKLTAILLLIGSLTFAQEDDTKARQEALSESNNLTWEANKELSEENFVEAEVDYRKAIAKSDENSAAPYNLGNAYYKNETYSEAFGRFKQAGELATDKSAKHNAYHNMGNVFMKRKDYQKAVDAYKEALRNDPTDEETRYNLALAKEMLKKEQEQNDQNEDNKDQQDQQDQKDENEDKKEGDNKDENKDQDQKEDGDKGDEGKENEEKKDENKEGDGDEKKEQNKKPEQGDQQEQEQPQQPRPNQLSKQQIQNLLEAMQNEEKKVQEKIDAQKVKGVKVKNEKDW